MRTATINTKISRLKALFFRNPVVIREFRSRMRGNRGFLTLTIHLILVSAIISFIYFVFASSNNFSPSLDIRKEIGRAIFLTIIGFEILFVSLVTPMLTAGAVSSERETQTYDLLKISLLSSRSFIIGKLLASLYFVLLLVFGTLPLLSIALLFGGVSSGEMAIGLLIILVSGFTFGSQGILVSSVTKRYRVSGAISQALAVLLLLGWPTMILILIILFDSSIAAQFSTVQELIIGAFGWILISTNPITAGVVSEIIILEEQAYFHTIIPIDNLKIIIPSPWIGFVFLFALLGIAYLWLSVLIVNQPDK